MKYGLVIKIDFLRGGDGDQKKHVVLEAAADRRAFDDLRRNFSARLEARKIIIAAEQGPGRLQPTLGERSLEVFYQWSLDPRISFPPMICRAAVSGPGITNSIPAGEPDPTIDYENPSMVAIVVSQQFPNEEYLRCFDPAEQLHLTTGIAHYLGYLSGRIGSMAI